MPRCPFCKEFSYIEVGSYECRCGEELPERVSDYRRERCICGKTVTFPNEDFEFTNAFPINY